MIFDRGLNIFNKVFSIIVVFQEINGKIFGYQKLFLTKFCAIKHELTFIVDSKTKVCVRPFIKKKAL